MLPVTANQNNLALEILPPDSDRPIRIVGTAQNPLWVLSDVCAALGIVNPRAAVADYTEEERGVQRLDTLGGPQQTLVVTEMGLYRLIFRSDKPAARQFQHWVFSEVLPSIRRHGCYPPPAVPIDPAALMLRQLADQQEASQALAREHEALVHRMEQMESRLKDMDGQEAGYITLAGYCRLNGIRLSEFDRQDYGRKLSKLHRKEGVRLGSAPDRRWGSVNLYRVDLVEKFFRRRIKHHKPSQD